jgi:hypothetical protein
MGIFHSLFPRAEEQIIRNAATEKEEFYCYGFCFVVDGYLLPAGLAARGKNASQHKYLM